MKILFITDLFPISNDNEPRTLEDFVNNWKQLGHTVDVIKPNFIPNSILRSKKLFPEQHYKQEPTDYDLHNLNFITPFWFNVSDKLPEGFDVEKYDVIASHMPAGNLFAQKLLEKKKKHWSCAIHASDIEVLTSPLYKIYFAKKLKNCFLKADKIAARSFVLKNKIEELIPEVKGKVFCAYSGIEEKEILPLEIFEKKANQFGEDGVIKITTVSSLIKRKNIQTIINALSKVSFKNWKYSIIGKGKELTYLKKLAKKLELSDKIEFLGNLPNQDVLRKLEKTDIFVLMSKRETFGMVYLEALAKGNIVIASKDDGIDGIMKNNQNGFCLSTEQELTTLLNELATSNADYRKETLKNAHSTITNYTKKIAASNYINILADQF